MDRFQTPDELRVRKLVAIVARLVAPADHVDCLVDTLTATVLVWVHERQHFGPCASVPD